MFRASPLPGSAVRRALAAGLLLLAALPGMAADDKPALPIPRFVSIRLGEANLRVGPGLRYPIDWVFKRKDMPVEITQEFDTWRKIRDFEGTEGWVNRAELGSKRSIIVTGEIRVLRDDADAAAAPVARLEPGVIGRLLECPSEATDWCRIEIGEVRGWLKKPEFWGVYPQEVYPQ